MISIRALEVPDYLHSSPHFENAFQGDDDDLTIDIPADCLKLSTEVETESDLRALLQTVRFWLIPEFLESSADFYTFMINNKDILPQILPDYREDFPILAKLNAAFHFPGNCTLIGRAAQLGMLGLMKYLRDTGTIWDTGVPLCITSIAAEHGQLDCLKYAVDSGCELKREASTLAAKQGHTSCLKYVHEKGANIYMNDCEEAIRNGHVDCVKYMVDSKALNILSPPSVAEIPSRLGNLGMLAYLLSVGCQATVGAASAAAAFDQIECLKLLLNAGCPVNAETLYVAVHCGAIECMKFLHNMGCPWEETTLHIPNNNWVLSACNNPFISFDVEKQISCFEFAAGNGCPVTSAAYALAIKYGSVYLIEVIQSRGVEMDVMPVKLAVRGRQLECLKYLLAQNAPCDTEAYIVAVHAKSLKSIEYLHAHGVPLDLTVSRAAVVQGRVDI